MLRHGLQTEWGELLCLTLLKHTYGMIYLGTNLLHIRHFHKVLVPTIVPIPIKRYQTRSQRWPYHP